MILGAAQAHHPSPEIAEPNERSSSLVRAVLTLEIAPRQEGNAYRDRPEPISALRQEGNVYRNQDQAPPYVLRAMSVGVAQTR
jgi:hypothetical protein